MFFFVICKSKSIHFGNVHFDTVDVSGVDIFGVDNFLGVDILDHSSKETQNRHCDT